MGLKGVESDIYLTSRKGKSQPIDDGFKHYEKEHRLNPHFTKNVVLPSDVTCLTIYSQKKDLSMVITGSDTFDFTSTSERTPVFPTCNIRMSR